MNTHKHVETKEDDGHIYYDIVNSTYETLDNPNKVERRQKEERVCIRRKWLLCLLVGILIGGGIAGVVVYLVQSKETNKMQRWSSWSTCSVTCGQGKRYRIKQLDGDHFERETCSFQPCPVSELNNTKHWSSWSTCSVTCGQGKQYRIKQQNVDQFETKSCSTESCPGMNKPKNWSSWSMCSATCGQGKQFRIKQMDVDNFETKTCSIQPCSADDVLLHMIFKRSSLHSNIYISDDNKVISNNYAPETPTKKSDSQRFRKYKGVMADRCVQDNTVIYYTVQYQYKIISTLGVGKLVLELGIAERDKIDNYHYVGQDKVNGWSFHLAQSKNTGKINLFAQHYKYGYDSVFSPSTAGSKIQGNFNVMIDRIQNTFSLIKNQKVVYTFHNVTSDVNLCPVFGVYAASSAEIKLQLINSYDFTKLP